MVYGCLGAGVALAIGFAAVELRQRYPLLDVRRFSNTTFATGAAAITMVFFALYGFFFIYMQFIQIALGYSALGTAVALTPLAPPLLFLAATSFWYLPRMGLRLVVFLGLTITGAGFICMRYLTLDSDYWELAWPILILTTGLGLTIAPTTTAIMSSIPDDKQGVGSAVNDTTREVGAALGIALAGSMLATQYTRVLAPSLDGFPQPVREAATRSLGEAIGVSSHLGPAGQGLVDAAMQAFTDATHFALTMPGQAAVLAVVLGAFAFRYFSRLDKRAPAPMGEQVGAHKAVLAKMRKREPLSPEEAEYATELVTDARSPMACAMPGALFTMGSFYIVGCMYELSVHGGHPSFRTFIGVLPMLASLNMTAQLRRVARLKSRLPACDLDEHRRLGGRRVVGPGQGDGVATLRLGVDVGEGDGGHRSRSAEHLHDDALRVEGDNIVGRIVRRGRHVVGGEESVQPVHREPCHRDHRDRQQQSPAPRHPACKGIPPHRCPFLQ